MSTFLYRCPNTGRQVQAWTDDPPVAADPEAYQSVKCIACSRLHWVNQAVCLSLQVSMDRLSLRQRELRCPETLQVAAGLARQLSQTVTLKKADGLSWRIQYASGFTQEPGEAISPLWT